MSVLVYINSHHGIGKNAFETVTYGKKLGAVTVVTNGNIDDASLAKLGEYGASKILVDKSLTDADDQQLTRLISNAADQVGADTIVFSHDHIAKNVAPRLSVRLIAGLVSGAFDIPDAEGTI